MNIFRRKPQPQPEPEIRYVEVPAPRDDFRDIIFYVAGIGVGLLIAKIISRYYRE